MNNKGLSERAFLLTLLAIFVFLGMLSFVYFYSEGLFSSGAEVHQRVQVCLENPSCNCLEKMDRLMYALSYGRGTNSVARDDDDAVSDLIRENCQSP